MIFKVNWMEKKNNDWIMASIAEGATQGNSAPTIYQEVSINRVNKKGETFPKFDEIQAGRDVEGEIWQSSAGKYYLFAPKVAKTGNNGAYKQKIIEDTMQRKEQSISRFQDDKEFLIMTSSTMRDAVSLAIAEQEKDIYFKDTPAPLEEQVLKFRKFLLDNWNVDPKDLDPTK